MDVTCPHCSAVLEAEEKDRGEEVTCPACRKTISIPPPQYRDCPCCGEEILFAAKKCKHCGEFLPDRHMQPDRKRGALNAAGICLLIGGCLMFIDLWMFLFYAPLFLASFVLSIVAMAQGRVAGGLGILLGAILGPLLIVGLLLGM